MDEWTIILGVAPVYALGALCVWDMERRIVAALLWPAVAIVRRLGG